MCIIDFMYNTDDYQEHTVILEKLSMMYEKLSVTTILNLFYKGVWKFKRNNICGKALKSR